MSKFTLGDLYDQIDRWRNDRLIEYDKAKTSRIEAIWVRLGKLNDCHSEYPVNKKIVRKIKKDICNNDVLNELEFFLKAVDEAIKAASCGSDNFASKEVENTEEATAIQNTSQGTKQKNVPKQMGGDVTTNLNFCVCFSGNKKTVINNDKSGGRDNAGQKNHAPKTDKYDIVFYIILCSAFIAGIIMLVLYLSLIDPQKKYKYAELFIVLVSIFLGVDLLTFLPLISGKLKKIYKNIFEIFIIIVIVVVIVGAVIMMSCAAKTNKGTLLYKPATESTCTTEGNIEYWYDEGKNKYFSDSKGEKELEKYEVVIPALGHSCEHHYAELPTCTQDGNIEYWECSRCGKYFTDKNGKTEITDKSSVITEKIPHNFSVEKAEKMYLKSAATCINKAVYYKSCFCGAFSETESETFEYGEFSTHNYVDGECEVCKSYQPTSGLNYSLNASDTYTVSGIGSVTATKIFIPSVYEGKSVTGISDSAFSGCSSLTSITIPDSVTSIGDDAFYNCSSLTEIKFKDMASYCKIGGFGYAHQSKVYIGGQKLTEMTSIVIPDGVTSIGSCAFWSCSSLTSITIPDSVTSIGSGVFIGCSLLTSITIPVGVTSIGDSAFWGCSSLTSITIPDSVTSIGDSAFSGCSSLKNISIPESVKTIGSSAFLKCTKLTRMDFPISVETIGNSALSGCSSLVSITLPFVGESVKSSTDTYQYPFGYIFGTTSYAGGTAISQKYYAYAPGSNTFSSSTYYIPNSLESVIILGGNILSGAFYNSKLKEITIPDNTKVIEKYAFYGCSALQSFIIPSNVERIEYMAFNECRALKNIVIPDNVTYLGESAFSGCRALESVVISNNLTSLEHVFSSCSSLKNVTIPDKVTNINGAFFMCTSLESIYLPKSVKSMENAFANIYNSDIDRKVYYKGTLTDWCDLQFASKADTPLIYQAHFYLSNSSGAYDEVTNLTIPNTVSKIGNYQFYGFSYLKSVMLSSSITTIGNEAFCQCVRLANINIPENVSAIGDEAFYQCETLSKIEIGRGVKSIGKRAFVGCYVWAEVTFKQTNGWWVANNSNAASGTNIPSSQLTNPSQAYTFLSASNYYADYYWKRS